MIIVKANQLLLPKEDLNITERKYNFNDTLFSKMKILAKQNKKRIICDFKNRTKAFIGNDFV